MIPSTTSTSTATSSTTISIMDHERLTPEDYMLTPPSTTKSSRHFLSKYVWNKCHPKKTKPDSFQSILLRKEQQLLDREIQLGRHELRSRDYRRRLTTTTA